MTEELPHRDLGATGLREAAARRGSWLRTLKAVAWSFFGVRRSTDHARDLEQLNPLHLIVTGIVLAAMFVGALVALVSWIISSGVAH
jgi:hypothetical protein